MNGEERRKAILFKLKNSISPISASTLATDFSVTRQIIVADIALLRASGIPISAKNRGYILDGKNEGLRKRIAVKHGKEEVSNEFYAIVDNGGKIIDVIVEHPVYGRISAELNISSRYDADEFVKKITQAGVNPLSLLTEGLHIHTIDVKDENTFKRITDKLSELGILIESD
ncbi:MAG: transcription repressor NadR [Clostridia bacterium]|nr:transcription repressor NadR [Clostridia bacterium]